MKHTVRHDLEPKKAKKLLTQLLETYQAHYEEYDFATDWDSEDTASVDLNIQGRDLQGTIEITPNYYNLDFDVPWLFLPFKKRIKQSVDEEVQRWLANF